MAEKKSLFAMINEWPLARKISLAVVALLSITVFSLIIMEGRVADYRLLYANLAEGDASSVIQWLKDQKIPYKLEGGGKAIHIPADKVYEARIELAGLSIPRGGGVGFEIFDKQSFGLTDFAQKVNYQRALQGELSRTISSLAPVEAARVMLALPEKRVFKDQQKEATASVIVKLGQGQQLKMNQTQGIIHLVANSIEGLDPENVTVIDSNGVVLSPKSSTDPNDPMTPGMSSHQQTMEKRLESRAQSLLDRALGVNNSLVKVTADLDFAQVEKTEEIFDPKSSVPRSEQVSEEKTTTDSGAGGIPGPQSNLQGAAAGGSNSKNSSRSSETINYEISKVVSRTVAPVGSIKSLSVAVLVGDKEVPAAGEGQEPTTTPRTAEELLAIENMVTSALGLDTGRGDQIKVVSMPFVDTFSLALEDTPVAEPSIYDYLPYVKYGLLALGVIVFYLVLIRPMVKSLQGPKTPYPTVGELEAGLAAEERLIAYKDPTQRIREEILRAETPPTHVIRSWLNSN